MSPLEKLLLQELFSFLLTISITIVSPVINSLWAKEKISLK